ncbi:palmitoyltransferase ZDHHC7-like [Cimex lectularius]|uniref:Palmitoyltransferase n=1 Tax=Cimex lectularius TaxID=79782 RepID=A0A8I6RM66_CIMLE|nr:palmitoyltransferase ZDHHC7-like [Cimex lectularius]
MSLFVKDPCGLICIALTYVAVFYADYVVVRWIVMQTMQDSLWAPFHVVLFNTVIFMVSFCHLRAMCSDPGAVPLPQSRMDFSDIHSGSESTLIQNEDWTVCTRCETYRPPRAHHCRICKRCIKRMDHHCPWINNCVGEKNQKYFIQFLICVGILSAYAFLLVIASWIRACPECSNEITIKQSRIVHCIILVMESSLFGIFVLAILYDQLEAITNDETTIEQLQGSRGSLSLHKLILSHICRLPCYRNMVVRTSLNAHSV